MRGSRVRVPFSALNLIPRNLRESKGFGVFLCLKMVLGAVKRQNYEIKFIIKRRYYPFLMDDKNNRNFSQVTASLGVGKKEKMKYNKKMDNI